MLAQTEILPKGYVRWPCMLELGGVFWRSVTQGASSPNSGEIWSRGNAGGSIVPELFEKVRER